MTTRVRSFISPSKLTYFQRKFTLLLRTSSVTLRIPAKVLIHVWSYDFYDMTLSTGKQRRHMIKYVYRLWQQRYRGIVACKKNKAKGYIYTLLGKIVQDSTFNRTNVVHLPISAPSVSDSVWGRWNLPQQN